MPPTKTARKRAAPVTRAFLFSDLRGYTSFVESHGDQVAADLLRAYRTLVRREVSRQDGGEVKTEGDSFYVVFASASAALDCAISILRRADAHNAREPATPLGIGVGVHAGETVEYDDQFVGSAVNIASRLASKAGAGELLVSDTLRGLVRTSSAYAMSDRGPLRLKGVGERVRAWSVEWREPSEASASAGTTETAVPPEPDLAPAPTARARAGSPPGQLVCPVVVGRETERARAEELLGSAASGRGQTLVVGGEAGVGKSAFVREVEGAAERSGFRILAGATVESDAGLPYAPFLAAVRSGFRGLDRDRLGRVLAQAAPDLAQLFPELRRTIAESGTASGAERQRLAIAFQRLFATFAREAPVLLVLEDLHWADEASLALLHHLARELRDARVLVLATYRSDEMHRRHPFLRVLAALQRERLVSEVTLRRLTREEVTELMRRTFAVTDPDVKVSDAFRDAIYDRSEGNPFFTEELLKTLVDSGDVFFREGTGWGRKDIGELTIPGSVLEAVRARVERLTPGAQESLAAAAAIGQLFSFDLLRAVRALPQAELLGHLREFIEHQLVTETGEDDAYRFRHALTREVVYDDLLVPERKQLHQAVAAAIAERPDAVPSLLAHHLLSGGRAQEAVPHLLEAAARAYRTDAPREAVAHYERALEIGLPPEQQARALEGLAEAYYLVDYALSRKAAEGAVRAYRQLGDRRGASRMLRLASRDVWMLGDAPRAAEIANEAIAEVGEASDAPELARAFAHLAQLHMTAGEHERAVELADRAIALAERLEDAWALANALITKGTTRGSMGHPDGLPLILRGRDLARERGLVETAVRGYNNAANVLSFTAHVDERIGMLEEGLEYGRRHGIEQTPLSSLLAIQHFWRGSWDEALAAADAVREGGIFATDAAWVKNGIKAARDGIAAALPEVLEQTERRVRMHEAQYFVVGTAYGADACALAGELDRGRPWAGRLRDRLIEDPGARWMLRGVGGLFAPLVALHYEMPELLDMTEAAIAACGVFRCEQVRWHCAVARAIVAGDMDAAGQAFQALYEAHSKVGEDMHPPAVLVSFAHAARRRGLALTPGWSDSLARAKAFAERVDARWWLEELAKVQP